MSELTLAIPNLNGGAFLAETLQSLATQNAPVRWHLQDALSQDDSIAIAERFRRDRDVIVNEPDDGQADALNRAFARMGGDIVGFLNSDDRLAPGAAAHVLDLFADPAIDLVVGGIRYMDGAGTPLREHFGRIDSLEEMLNLFDVWFQERQWVQPEVFFRRRLWEKVGPFDTAYRYAFDYDYWVRCFRAGARIRTTPKILAEFRLHPAQKSADAWKAGRELFRIARRHVAESREISPGFRRTMAARIDYSLRQGELTAAQSTARRFFLDLCRHPNWLRGRECRQRIAISLSRRLGLAPGRKKFHVA